MTPSSLSLTLDPKSVKFAFTSTYMASESVLEQQRKLHEERERLEDALVKERILKKPTVRGNSN